MKSEIAETTDNMTSDYEGIWLTVPSGQGGYTIRAIGVWIKDITDNSVEYELIGFEGSTTSARTEGDYSCDPKNTASSMDIFLSSESVLIVKFLR